MRNRLVEGPYNFIAILALELNGKIKNYYAYSSSPSLSILSIFHFPTARPLQPTKINSISINHKPPNPLSIHIIIISKVKPTKMAHAGYEKDRFVNLTID